MRSFVTLTGCIKSRIIDAQVRAETAAAATTAATAATAAGALTRVGL